MRQIITILFFITGSISAYSLSKPDYIPIFSIKVGESLTGTGYGTVSTLGTNMEYGLKTLEFNLLVNNHNGKPVGIDAIYKHAFQSDFFYSNSHSIQTRKFTPFIFYNCAYRSEKNEENALVTKSLKQYEIPPSTRYASFEHFVGFGLQTSFKNNIYIEQNIGLGGYMGIVNTSGEGADLGIHRKNHGFTMTMKLGVGYKFK